MEHLNNKIDSYKEQLSEPFVTNNHYEDLKQYKVSLETLIEKIKEAK